MDSRSLKKTVNWLAAVIWMIVIFAFSNQNAAASSQTSSGFVDLAAKWLYFAKEHLFHDTGAIDTGILTYLIRKGAHLFLYLVLGVLVCRAFCSEGRLNRRVFFLTVLFCFIYACSDEIHQIFQNGRSCEFGDVLIDTSGAVIGTCLCMLVKRVRHTPE